MRPDDADRRRQEPTAWSNQSALQRGSARMWVVPATVLAVIAIVQFAFSLSLQLVLPVIGIVFTIGLWAIILVVSRRGGDPRRRNVALAWLMGGLAVGALLIAIGVYLLEAYGS